MSKKKLFKISAACAGMLAGLGLLAGSKIANAAKIYLKDKDNKDNATYTYKVGLEGYLYNAKKVSEQVPIAIQIDPSDFAGGYLGKPYTITFRFEDGKGLFAPGMYYLVERDKDNNVIKVYAVGKVSSLSSEISLVNNDDVYKEEQQVNAGEYATNAKGISAGTMLYLVTNSTNNNNFVDPTITLTGKDADCNNLPTWTMTLEINGGAQGKVGPIPRTFAETVKAVKVSLQVSRENNFNAILNSENDFKTFLYYNWNGISNSTQLSYTILNISKDNPEFEGPLNTSGKISFDLVSLYPQSGVKAVKFEGSNCTTSDNTKWSCSNSTSSLFNKDYTLTISVSGNDQLNPTIWTLKNFNLSASGMTICYSVPDQDIGTWRGGVEAIIPFVRVNEAEQAYTTIVLTNRTNNNLKVYASLFDNDKRLIVPNTQIGEIPAKDTVRITWQDLKNTFGSNPLLSKGTSMKIMIVAPTRELFSDDYVQGYVVYSYGGQARYVPIQFVSVSIWWD